MLHAPNFDVDLPVALLDAVPNPVFVKGEDLGYVWVNRAFEEMFGVHRADIVGKTDADVFDHRQGAHDPSADRTILEQGEVAQSYEAVYSLDGDARETLTQKSRLTLPSGAVYLVGIMNELTDMIRTQAALVSARDDQEKLANRDGLTGVLTRRAFLRRIAGVRSSGQGIGLLVFHIDKLEQIDDTYGLGASDAALLHFSRLVERQKRKDDVFARLGEEQFALLLPGADRDAVWVVGQSVCDTLRSSPFAHQDLEIGMTVSVGGLASDAESEEETDAILIRTNELVAEAKSAGGDRIMIGPK